MRVVRMVIVVSVVIRRGMSYSDNRKSFNSKIYLDSGEMPSL